MQSLLNDTMSTVAFIVGMNSGLYFTVTLVALAWFSAGTCRANTNGTITNSLNVTMTTATTTAATGTTAAPPLVPNNTVSVLEVGGVDSLKAR